MVKTREREWVSFLERGWGRRRGVKLVSKVHALVKENAGLGADIAQDPRAPHADRILNARTIPPPPPGLRLWFLGKRNSNFLISLLLFML